MKKSAAIILMLIMASPLFGQRTTESAVWGSRTSTGTVQSDGRPKFSADLQNARGDERGLANVIVQFVSKPTAQHHKKVTSRGGSLTRDLSLIKASAYRMPVASIAELASDPDVVYVSLDRQVKGLVDLTTAATNATIAQSYGWDGTGIGIAVIDSGVAQHQDLTNSSGASRVVYSQDFTGTGTTDLYGHGTHVAGILASRGSKSAGGNFSRTFKGFAPNANIISLKVLDGTGSGTDSQTIAAINQALDRKSV